MDLATKVGVSARFLPGVALLLVISLLATKLSELVVIGGKHPLEPTALAVVLGLALRAGCKSLPERYTPGMRMWEKFLIWGVVLIGASLNFTLFLSEGVELLILILITMAVSFTVIYALGRAFRLPETLALLLTVGTTICGGSAIAITAPLIRAREDETSYAIGTITLWGLLAILCYPKFAQLLQVTDMSFGIFAGTAIHSTPQVVGAGFVFSDQAGNVATAVKLIRNCFMAPLALLIAFYYRKNNFAGEGQVRIAKAFPWFLFGFFLMAGASTAGLLPLSWVERSTTLGKWFILMSMAGIGLATDFRSFRSIGTRPLVVGLIGSIVVALVSILMIRLLF